MEVYDEKLKKRISQTLLKIAKSAGRKYFIGALWMAILRSQRARNEGIKMLASLLPKLPNTDEQQMSDDDMDSDNEKEMGSAEIKDKKTFEQPFGDEEKEKELKMNEQKQLTAQKYFLKA